MAATAAEEPEGAPVVGAADARRKDAVDKVQPDGEDRGDISVRAKQRRRMWNENRALARALARSEKEGESSRQEKEQAQNDAKEG